MKIDSLLGSRGDSGHGKEQGGERFTVNVTRPSGQPWGVDLKSDSTRALTVVTMKEGGIFFERGPARGPKAGYSQKDRMLKWVLDPGSSLKSFVGRL